MVASRQNIQLEKVVDAVLKSGDVQALNVFLQRNIFEGISIKSSQQFLTKLDTLVQRCLDQKDAKSASVGFAVIYKCGKNLKLPGSGGQGLLELIGQGLIKKMVQWFEKCRQLWIQCGPLWDENLLNLSEDFFEMLMVVHESCKEGTYKVTESFLYPVGQLGVDPKIYILIQKEAIRKFNLILDKIPRELKKEKNILTSQNASDIMIKLAGQVLESGDYDLQTALMEALCRIATADQRKELADRWFSMEHVAKAFAKIHDSDFETDCRKFLNLVNGMKGDRRRVYSYPCLEAHLDNHELLMPADEKLEEFWIDFNLGSHSISFYFSLADEEAQESQWETICINMNEVHSYTVTEKGERKVLQVKLSDMVVVGEIEGSSVTIHFSSSLDVLQAAQSVFGQNRNKFFVGKTGTSVAKTAIKIVMDENGSQVVPESQCSFGESEKNAACYLFPTLTAPIQMVTPAKTKMSESSTFVCNSAEGSVHAASSLSAVMPSTQGKRKPSLAMVRSGERKGESGLGEKRTPAMTCSHGTTPGSRTVGGTMKQSHTSLQNSVSKQTNKNSVDKHKKNKPVVKTEDVILAGDAEEQPLEDGFVPDTQPRLNTSSTWSKLSVSDMLMMPTQKINTQPIHEASLVQEREFSSTAQRFSVPGSGPISQKQLHTELTQRLQQVLKDRNQDFAPHEPIAPPRKTSPREDSKGTYSVNQSTPKVQQAQINGPGKQKHKSQMSLKTEAATNKDPVKASTAKSQQEGMASNLKAETSKAFSSKEKRDAEVTENMVKLISSHYEVNTQSTVQTNAENIRHNWIPPPARSIFNMSRSSTAKKEASRDVSLMKSYSKAATSSSRQRKDDVFAFDVDAPTIIGGKDKPFTNTSAVSSSGIHDSSELPSTTRKEQPVKKEKRYVKKHLFSDTDTDHTMTEVSWLRESSRKPKPKVTKYSRQSPVKPKVVSPYIPQKSPELSPPSPKPVKAATKPNKKKQTVKERVEQSKKITKPATAAVQPKRQCAAGRRPKRTAATFTKCYREPDTDDSQTESNKSPVPKQRPVNILQETSKVKKKNFVPVQDQMNPLKDSRAVCQTLLCPSPPVIEKMRSTERSASTLGLIHSPLITPRGSPLPTSPDPACRDTPSPILLLPKPRSTVSSKGKIKPPSLYNGEMKHSTSKAQSTWSDPCLTSQGGQTPTPNPLVVPSVAEISLIQEPLCPTPQSPLSLSQPLLTSTLFEMNKPSVASPAQSPLLQESVNHECLYGFRVSSVSQVSLSQSSSKSSACTSRVKDISNVRLTVSHKTEKTPSSDRDESSAQPHVSGPSRKRRISSSSNSEKEERKKSKMRGQHSPRMKPRKLFKSFTEVSAEGEVSPVKSPHTVCTSHWEAEVVDGNVDMEEDLDLAGMAVGPSDFCQQLSSELKKKFQNHFQTMDVYNKQSLKTVHQHVSSLNMQMTKYRTQKLEQVRRVLSKEIHKLEQDDILLKSMEKDLTICWKKQSVAFHSYQEQETRRSETLKEILQSNECHSLEYEQSVFTSQMCLVRKDMKSVQDRLLCEMREGELNSVKRGLHALFFPDGARSRF